jgi:hypothetical protein
MHEKCEDLAPNLSDKRISCRITTRHHFSPGNFWPKITLLAWLGTLELFCFPDWKHCHFDITKVLETESQALLNTLTEHDFQDAFKKMAQTLGMVNTRRRGLLRGWWWSVAQSWFITRWQYQSQKLWIGHNALGGRSKSGSGQIKSAGHTLFIHDAEVR